MGSESHRKRPVRMERGTPPAQARSRRTHERLLRAGAIHIARVGYEHTSVANVAREAGLTQGAMYNHFGSKWLLAEEILERQLEQVEAVVAHVRDTVPSAFGRAVCLSADLADLIDRDELVRASIQLTLDPSLVDEDCVWQTWERIADDLVASAPSGGNAADLRGERMGDAPDAPDFPCTPGALGSLAIGLVLSAWVLTRDDPDRLLRECLQEFWRTLAALEPTGDALAFVEATFNPDPATADPAVEPADGEGAAVDPADGEGTTPGTADPDAPDGTVPDGVR